jgi:DNA-binding NtrC family response regulator
MKRLLLVEPGEGLDSELVAHLRNDGREVIEVDEQRAFELCQEQIDAVFVWRTREAARAAAVLRDMDGSPDSSAPLGHAAHGDIRETVAVEANARVLVGETPAMRDLRATLRRLACRPRTHVLVGGEPGSGKQTLARALHHATDPAHEFIHLTPARLASVLEGGAASLSDGALLYLSSIGEVPMPDQRRLADLLAELEGCAKPPVRLVIGAMRAGQQVSLGRLVERAVHPVLAARVPVLLDLLPLRKRKSDIPLLVSHLLGSWSQSSGLPRPEITPAALEALAQHGWPGNVRELANALERAALTGVTRIDVADLPAFEIGRAGFDYELPTDGIDWIEFERAMLLQALALARGNQTQAALLLGLTRDQVRYRMSKFKITRSGSKDEP